MTFNGFISYSHAADGRLAPAIQQGLHRLAKPWHRRRALWVFRDQTGLSVTPALWKSIQDALDNSEYFVLLASPEAARSQWVNREVTHWTDTKSAERILPVVTDGVWEWDPARGDFTADSTAVPAALRGVFTEEPLYLDLRWARNDRQVNLRHSRFRDAIAQLAAPMHGLSKDELEGEDVRQHRRAQRLRAVAVGSLMLLTFVAILTGVLAVRNADEANANAAEARRQQVEASTQRDNADRFAGEARRQEELVREQEARAKAAADETRRQEKLTKKQQKLAQQASAEAAQQQANASRQEQLAGEAANRAREQERLANASATEARKQQEYARDQQRLAKKSEAEARELEKLAKEQEQRAERAAAQARKEQANAKQQQRIAIGRRVLNQAKAVARDDMKLALKLGVAAAKIQADDEVRSQLAGFVTSTHYVDTANYVRKVTYLSDDRLIAEDAHPGQNRTVVTLWAVAEQTTPGMPTYLGDLGAFDQWAVNASAEVLAGTQLRFGKFGKEPIVVLLDPTKPADERTLAEIPVDSEPSYLTFSQDGRTLFVGTGYDAAGDLGYLLDVSDPHKPKRLPVKFDSSSSPVKEATFSPNGKILVTLHGDLSAGVWDLSDPAKAPRVATLTLPLQNERIDAV
ncbi:MAG TPA: TIR domain-containing protein, partial [Actinoplanes sp.]|nr:TIR domain-containing protein [Actinoplanes sp.]